MTFLNRGLPAQAADLISRCIAAGRWREWLPGERRLGRELQISRGTLRAALEILKKRNLIASIGGHGNRIRTGGPPMSVRVPGLIGVLAPEPLAIRFDPANSFTSLNPDAPAYSRPVERILSKMSDEAMCGTAQSKHL